jgi:hypothetical protein
VVGEDDALVFQSKIKSEISFRSISRQMCRSCRSQFSFEGAVEGGGEQTDHLDAGLGLPALQRVQLGHTPVWGLMTSDLSRLVEVFAISKRCYRVILFNFWGTITVDTVGIVLAFFGQLSPIAAALIHVVSELTFILNSARLFRHRMGGSESIG